MRLAWLPAALAASVLFGLYHFAHSSPFSTIPMVALLTGVGFVTSAFFFLSRDIYATIVLHNFLGVFGVVQALAASGRLETLNSLQPTLIGMAAATAVVLGLLAPLPDEAERTGWSAGSRRWRIRLEAEGSDITARAHAIFAAMHRTGGKQHVA